MSDAARFALGDLTLQSGAVLPGAWLSYRTHGTLAADHGNVILYPTSYGAQHTDVDWLITPDGILDPTRWFIVQIDMLGNGLSTSPSHLADPGPALTCTHVDNVTAQERLLREVFGITRLALIYGWSMGAQQAYHWGVLFPERVARIAALCGTARTTEHNRLFLLSLEAALQADPAWNGTTFDGVPERGFRAFARIYASWAASQEFYRRREYLNQGYRDLDDYLARAWEPAYRRRHPLDHLAMLGTWQRNDVAAHPCFGGDLARALGTITARSLVMPASTDLYFTVADCVAEAALIPGAEVTVIDSWWGHRAGNPAYAPAEARFIRTAVAKLLAE